MGCLGTLRADGRRGWAYGIIEVFKPVRDLKLSGVINALCKIAMVCVDGEVDLCEKENGDWGVSCSRGVLDQLCSLATCMIYPTVDRNQSGRNHDHRPLPVWPSTRPSKAEDGLLEVTHNGLKRGSDGKSRAGGGSLLPIYCHTQIILTSNVWCSCSLGTCCR
jgi:hypothetical protein